MIDQKQSTYLLRFCSINRGISKHLPDPRRSQWQTEESLFSCPTFPVRPRSQVRTELRRRRAKEWWKNWCTERHSGPSPVSVLPPSSPRYTVSAEPRTTACALAELGYSSSLRCVKAHAGPVITRPRVRSAGGDGRLGPGAWKRAGISLTKPRERSVLSRNLHVHGLERKGEKTEFG